MNTGESMENPWKIISILSIILFASSIILGLTGAYDQVSGTSFFTRKSVSPVPLAQDAVTFIRTNLIGDGESVRLLNVSEVSGVYRIWTEYTTADGKQIVDAYMTKDGKFLFPASYRMDNLSLNRYTSASANPGRTESSTAAAKTCNGITKQDTPVMEVFVASYCPYGTQIQGILADIAAKIPTLSAHIKVRYLGEVADGAVQSMHGPMEAAENLRQICIREEQPDMYWKYVTCFTSTRSSETCEKSTGVDSTRLSGCISDKNRGIRYAQEDFKRSAAYGAGGSPTLVLNGVIASEFPFGGRTPEAVKSLLCCGFTTQPDSCGISLSTLPAGTGQGTC